MTSCPICTKQMTELKNIVCDHDHHTGEIRGPLCRWCNAQLGKMENAANRAKRTITLDQWLDNAIAWRRKQHTGLMYPTHKTDAEKKEAAAAKRKKAAAARARAVMTKGK
jgi:Recombination endonuclease VII.